MTEHTYAKFIKQLDRAYGEMVRYQHEKALERSIRIELIREGFNNGPRKPCRIDATLMPKGI